MLNVNNECRKTKHVYPRPKYITIVYVFAFASPIHYSDTFIWWHQLLWQHATCYFYYCLTTMKEAAESK